MGDSFRILVAEDVESLAHLMRFHLEESGFVVETAVDGEECLRKVPLFRPDLIVLDIMMPKVHGLEIIRQLKAVRQTQHIGILVCSAKDYKSDRDQIEALGVTSFLKKPFEPTTLVEAVAGFFRVAPRAEVDEFEVAGPPPAKYLPELDRLKCAFTLWGTRGSTPVSHARYARHGGNTSCLSFQIGDEMVIFDAGTGIRELGLSLARSSVRKVHLFIGHTHWDHIQGFPFFNPAFVAGFQLHLYGAAGFGKDLRDIFVGQLDRDYFPVQFEDLRSSIHFHVLGDEAVPIGEAQVTWEYANHPGAAVGFKVTVAGRSLVYLTDDEFMEGYLGSPAGLDRNHPAVVPYRSMLNFVDGVDVLVHEAQYTNEEYASKVSWGHSSVSNACVLAKLSGARRWIVTHHDPLHDDARLDEKLLLTQQLLAELGATATVSHAYDGQVILL